MGCGPSASIFYGVYLYDGEDGWAVEEADEWGSFEPDWCPYEDGGYIDASDAIHDQLLRHVGFSQESLDGKYQFERSELLKEKWGLEIIRHRHHEFTSYSLAVSSTEIDTVASRHVVLSFSEAGISVLKGFQDDAHEAAPKPFVPDATKLKEALAVLGVTPTEPIGWLLAPMYG